VSLCFFDDLYIVTEFVNGGNLRSKLDDKSQELDWKLRACLLKDFSLAMNYLHAKGIIHRDLKSHNLLVTQEWRLKVCDFGLARPAPEGEEQKSGMTIVGTNEWMAPEVAMGEKYDTSADVFSYGMVIYELITREEPPVRKLRDGYSFKPDDFKSKIPADAPPKLWELMVECTATNPGDRPDFKTIVGKIKEIHDDATGTGTSTSNAPPPVKSSSKKR